MGLLGDARRLNGEWDDKRTNEREQRRVRQQEEGLKQIANISGYDAIQSVEMRSIKYLNTYSGITSERSTLVVVGTIDDVTVAYGESSSNSGNGLLLVQRCDCGRDYLAVLTSHAGQKDMLGKRQRFVELIAQAIKKTKCSYCIKAIPDNCPTCGRTWERT